MQNCWQMFNRWEQIYFIEIIIKLAFISGIYLRVEQVVKCWWCFLQTLSTENITDWRRELLQAVQHVFNKEHDAFIMALHAQAPSLNNMDAMTLLNLLKEQVFPRIESLLLL